MHVGDNARKNGGACDCVTQERKGGSVKRAVEHIEFGDRYERSALFRVWHEELRSLSDQNLWMDRLLGKQHFMAGMGCHVSSGIFWRHVSYFSCDVILVGGGNPVLVEASCCFGVGRFGMLVTPLAGGVIVTKTASRWRAPDALDTRLLHLQDGRAMQRAALWDFEGDGIVIVIER